MDEKLLLNDLGEIVAIPSVYSAPEPNAPYGSECRRALEWFVQKARSYGLKAENIDNVCAYAEVGEGDECIGALGHLDVVPAGNGWATPPFKMIEENGKVYGRGVGDDKGAVVVCLHALKELKDNNVKLKRRVRLIVGADEERGSSCIRHYVQTGGEIPAMSFVPDSEFPVINSEKGISHIRLEIKNDALLKNIKAVSGAECYNAVPDRATATVVPGSPLEEAIKSVCGGKATSELFERAPAVQCIVEMGARPQDFEIAATGKDLTIVANGVAEHASTPEKGDNALWKLLCLLNAFNDSIESELLPSVCEYLCTPLAASKLGIYVDDPKSGDLTMCMSHAQIKDGKLGIVIDFRLPLGVKPDGVAAAIEAKTGAGMTVLDYHENLYIDPDAPLIRTLLKVYRKATGDMTEPLQTGGGTYARELPNSVAFGCTPLDIDINMHRADENFPVVQLFKNFEIYYEAMQELANL